MKNLKKLISGLVIVSMVLSIFLMPSMKAEASEIYGAVPQKVRIYVQDQDTDSLVFDYENYGEYIKNVKSNSKNLKAKQVLDWQESGTEDNSNYAKIGLYAYKKGTYKVTFDIYNADGTKKSSHKVTVYAYSDTAVKSITIGKTDVTTATEDNAAPEIVTIKSGKLKVNLNKGYKLTGLYYATANQDGTTNVNEIKNGKKLTLGTVIPTETMDVFGEDGNYKIWSTQLFAPTVILVEYKDKYTKEYYYVTYTVYKPVQ